MSRQSEGAIANISFKKQADPSLKASTCLILVPTRELAEQVQKVITSFTAFCGKDVRSVNLTQKVSDAVQQTMLADFPDLIVSTPTRVLANVNNSALSLEKLTHLVIDEADLVLSYGYDEDINALSKAIPRGVQTFLMSATLTSEVDTLKSLFCRSPVILKLEDREEKGAEVSQFVVRYVLGYVLMCLATTDSNLSFADVRKTRSSSLHMSSSSYSWSRARLSFSWVTWTVATV
jgi:superfamily II DNA/RNA helicase